ncbi:MAG TPA: ATP-binding protein, partial [Spirochaetia bacterium]|nr:ATP-binding protein [Spirochaetia bacterium]
RVAEALTGWKEPDALGRPVDEVVQFVDEAGAKSSAWPAARVLPGQPSAERSANLYLVSRDGSRRPISESAAPIRTGSGDVTGAVLVFSDQTLVRALQGQLLHAQKMEAIGRLAGGIAHDFNNMLGVVLGHASQIAERVGPDSPLFEDLQAIVEAAERSANLTRQLLGFARQQVVEPRTLNLNEEVSSLARMLQRLIGEDITLRLDLDAELWPVWIDPTQVDQVLANLATNARDAIGSIGSITISTRNVPAPHAPASTAAGIPSGDHVLLSFSDTGAGMDAQTLQRVFEPFFTTKPIGKGTGLGLATVFGIVNQNHGTVSVSSEPGVGTTFRVALPRAAGPAPAAGEEAVRDMPRGTETLLVVEDEPALLRIVTRTLEQCGYTVLGAGTPSRALDFTDEQITAADLLITDVIMPGMNGFDLLERLRARAPGLRALFMSGYTAEVVAERGAALDGATFIAKPFKRFELARKVREMLDAAG